jgi:autotransporter-associated beta strand protein
VTISNLTLNGAPSGGGSVLSLTPGAANNPAVAMLNCGTLTLNSTNTMSIAAVNIGTFALVKYTGAIAGSGNCTNLTLPQGATGFVSNSVANATLYAAITSTGPGLVWTGTNAAALNSWDINLSTNWTVSGVPTSYHQIISPGDSVLFNDIGSGTVLLNTNAAPASVIISNNVKVYTFSGTGGISGPSSLLKVGTGTAILNLTNDTYVGNTIISNGTLQVVNYGVGSSLSPTANLTIGSSGTLSLSAQQANVVTRFGELTGAGVINYSGGFNSILNFGGNTGGTWNGSIRDAGGGGLSLTKTGSGTWVIGGTNYFNNGDGFFAASQAQLNGGTTILTNNSWISTAVTEFWIAQGAGSTSTVVVAGGTLAVSNSWLCVGRGDATANGTLIVNSGTVLKTGNNTMVIGSLGATGTLIVNGGQVLDNNEMLLGESPSSVANLYLNGGLIQATDIKANNNGGFPIVPSVAYLNGGTVRANTNVADFIQVSSQVMSNGFTLDDNGYSVGMVSQPFQAGDAFNGGLIKKGSGSLYLDAASTYTGTTLVTNGLLAGIGSVTGPVVVAPAGTIGAGNAAGNGAFSINNNLTIQGGSFMRINKTGGTPAQDQVVVSGNITYGGVLVVSNITSDATVLVAGDTFPLFSVTGTKTGNFSSIVGTPGVGLLYSFNPTTGVLSVAPSVNTTPTNLVAVVSGNTLTLSWPADHLGWRLQVQTNSIDTGISGNWSDVAGSTSVNTVNATINPANGAVFYRMVYP